MKRFSLALVLVLAACGSKSTTSTQTTPPPATSAGDPSCPLEVPGTSVTVEDTTNGAALVFVTTGDPSPVRASAATLADMHTKHDGAAKAMGMMFPATWKATASEVEAGARVDFAAAKPEEVAGLQSELRMHASHLTGGSCAM